MNGRCGLTLTIVVVGYLQFVPSRYGYVRDIYADDPREVKILSKANSDRPLRWVLTASSEQLSDAWRARNRSANGAHKVMASQRDQPGKRREESKDSRGVIQTTNAAPAFRETRKESIQKDSRVNIGRSSPNQIPRDGHGELPPKESLKTDLPASNVVPAMIAGLSPSRSLRTVVNDRVDANTSDPRTFNNTRSRSDAERTVKYTATLSGTLVIVADRPIQHHIDCRRRSACAGSCLCDCQYGFSCGQSHSRETHDTYFHQQRCASRQRDCGEDQTWNQSGLATGWLLGSNPLGFRVGGWMAQSFTVNGNTPEFVRFNGLTTFVDRSNEYQLNQTYLFLERQTDTRQTVVDIGGRADFLYGTDARFTRALGLDDNIVSDNASRFYKMSFPQVFAEFAVQDLTVQIGRFYTILGYETVTAPDNFFISHSYAMQYAEPFTHTGVLGYYNGPHGVSLLAGFTRGWDNWEDNNDTLDVIAGLNWTSQDEQTSISAAVTSGPQDDLGLDYTTLTSVLIQHAFCAGWNYVFQCDIGFENNGAASNQDAEWYGIANYLTFDINACWTLGVRQEWFSDDDGVRVGGLGSPEGIDWSPIPAKWQEVALGINYRPRDNWTVRSEARWDRFDPLVPFAGGPFDDLNQRGQFVWSFDLIVGF